MTKPVAILLISMALAGCVSAPMMQLSTTDLPARTAVKIVDKSKSGAIEISYFAYSNIYSCHYGTTKLDSERMVPDPVEYMRKYLSSKLASPASIEVERFDIYTNVKARYHKILAGSTINTTVGSTVTFGRYEPPNGTIVGCKGTDTGEYVYGEVKTSIDPILIYLNGTYNGEQFRLRTISDLNTQGLYPSSKDLKIAIDMALDALVKRFATDAMTK